MGAYLLDRAAVAALPRLPNVVFMARRKFGASGDLPLTWSSSHPVRMDAVAITDAEADVPTAVRWLRHPACGCAWAIPA